MMNPSLSSKVSLVSIGVAFGVYWSIAFGGIAFGLIFFTGGVTPAHAAVPGASTNNVPRELAPEVKSYDLDVPYVPTPAVVVEKMLELAEVKNTDVVYDLGCGDGRIVVTAAKKYGARGVGIDIDPARVKESIENVRASGVEKLVSIRRGDVFKANVSDATVIMLYMLPNVNLKLRSLLFRTLKPGTRIVSHDFGIGDWKPIKKVQVKDDNGRLHSVLLWKVEPKSVGPKPKAARRRVSHAFDHGSGRDAGGEAGRGAVRAAGDAIGASVRNASQAR